jgi:hypothetical protein
MLCSSLWKRCRCVLSSLCSSFCIILTVQAVQFKVLEPVTIKSWAIIPCMQDKDLRGGGMGSLGNWIQNVVMNFRSLGITIPDEPYVQWASDMGRNPDPQLFSDAVQQTLRQTGKEVDIIFVIKPRRGALLCSPSLSPSSQGACEPDSESQHESSHSCPQHSAAHSSAPQVAGVLATGIVQLFSARWHSPFLLLKITYNGPLSRCSTLPPQNSL